MLTSIFSPCACVRDDEFSRELIDVVDVRSSEESESLLGQANYITELANHHATVDSEWVRGTGPEDLGAYLLALATPPVEFDVVVPDNVAPGETFYVRGPHGKISVVAPQDRRARLWPIKCRLAPLPDLCILIPPRHKAGDLIRHMRDDGVEIAVPVPEGLQAGDTLEVTPPVLMVSVPGGAKGGDVVVFQAVGPIFSSCDRGSEYCRARVPQGVKEGEYFAARLPRPQDDVAEKADLNIGKLAKHVPDKCGDAISPGSQLSFDI